MLARLRTWWRKLPKNQRLLIGVGAPVAAGAALLTRRRTPTAAPVAASAAPGVFGAITPPEDFMPDGSDPYDDSALYDALYGLESQFADQIGGLQAGQASFFSQIGSLLSDFIGAAGGPGAAPGSTSPETATASTSSATSGGFGGKVSTSGTSTQTAAAAPTDSPVPIARTQTVVTQTQQQTTAQRDYSAIIEAIAGAGVNTAAAQGVSTVSPTSGQSLVNFRGRMVTAEQYRQALDSLNGQTAAQAAAQYEKDYAAVVAARTAPVSGLEASTTAPARTITRTNTTTGQTVSVGVGPSTTKTTTPRIE